MMVSMASSHEHTYRPTVVKILTDKQVGVVSGRRLQEEGVNTVRQQTTRRGWQYNYLSSRGIIQGVVVGATGHKLAKLVNT